MIVWWVIKGGVFAPSQRLGCLFCSDKVSVKGMFLSPVFTPDNMKIDKSALPPGERRSHFMLTQ